MFFECLPAEEAVEQGQCDDCQVLIVDPPRRGLDAGVLQLLQGQHAEKELSNGNERTNELTHIHTYALMLYREHTHLVGIRIAEVDIY